MQRTTVSSSFTGGRGVDFGTIALQTERAQLKRA